MTAPVPYHVALVIMPLGLLALAYATSAAFVSGRRITAVACAVAFFALVAAGFIPVRWE